MSLQFYAGIPLVDENDAALGTLCVLDTRPRVLSPLQLNALRVLAKQLLAQLEVRKLLVREKSLRAEVELAHRRAAFLADAAALLAASLATDRTLEAVARLAVRDDGRGITADLLPDVFEQFRQDEHGVGRRIGGLGLGLAIAKHIVTAVGGTISAHSDGEGKGASFIVTLPLSLTTSGPAPALAAPTDVIFEGAASLLGARVLVVDDDADTRSVLAELLSANGAEVSTAESAEDGFEVFRRERPDVIVSDVMMGGASGYDLVRRVRDLPPQDGGRTPALALTGNTSTADRTSALAAGFHFYLPKPIDPNELLTVVAALRAGDAP